MFLMSKLESFGFRVIFWIITIFIIIIVRRLLSLTKAYSTFPELPNNLFVANFYMKLLFVYHSFDKYILVVFSVICKWRKLFAVHN